MAAARKRAPLAELPLFDFVPPPSSKCAFPSPLSLPAKRGPPTPRAGSTSTPKRPRPTCVLHTDDMGVGKSPARRLFADSPATPTPKKASTSKLAPSPPLAPVAGERRAPSVHDVGFVILQDPDDGGQGPVSTVTPGPVSSRDEENIPPAAVSPVKKVSTPRSSKPCIRAG